MNISAYLARIDADVSGPPSLPQLRALCHRHMIAVPFETLDVSFGQGYALGEERALDVVVTQRRGGNSLVVNAAFGALLRALGYRVRTLAGRVHGPGAPPPELGARHASLGVWLDQPYFVDVACGTDTPSPMAIRDGHLEDTPVGPFQMRASDAGWHLERSGPQDAGFRPFIDFTLAHRPWEHFAPGAAFDQARVGRAPLRCSRRTEDGAIYLRGRQLWITTGDHGEGLLLDTDEALRAALLEHFGVAWSGPLSPPA